MAKSDWRASGAALDEALSGEGDVLITIHGTNDADAADEGTRWWQRGSDFLARTVAAARVRGAPLLRVAPFHWTGENSDEDRLDAGRALAGLMTRLERAKRPYHLLAHSHGGNVALAAVAHLAAHGRRAAYLRSVSSLGTPFLHRRLRLIEVANALYLLVSSLIAIVAGLLVVFYLALPRSGPMDSDERLGAFFVLCVLALFPYLALRYALRRLREQGRLARLARRADLGTKWLAAASHRDEAVGLLRRAKTFTARFITPRSMRRSLWRVSVVAAMIAAVLTMSLWGWSYLSAEASDVSRQIGLGYIVVILVFPAFALYLGLAWALSSIGPQFLMSWAANRSISSGLRAAVFGEDSRYTITGADAVPERLQVEQLWIDRDTLGGLTEEQTNRAAAALYDDLIELHPGQSAVVQPDTLWQRLNEALYHNAYFHDREVVEALGGHIAKCCSR